MASSGTLWIRVNYHDSSNEHSVMSTAAFVVASQSGTGRRLASRLSVEVTANIRAGWRVCIFHFYQMPTRFWNGRRFGLTFRMRRQQLPRWLRSVIEIEVLHVIPKHSDRNIKATLPKCMSGFFCLPVTVVPAITTALEVLLFSPVA